jgi:hypothetical protein
VLALTVGRSSGTKKKVAEAQDPSAWHLSPRPTRPAEGILFTVAIQALGSVLLAITAFTRPATEVVHGETPFQHRGRFSYAAGAPATVYSGASLETGDPIYDALVPSFVVDFDYEFASAEMAEVEGSLALNLTVSEPNGWSRSLPLQPATPFTGTRAHIAGTVPMATVRRMISSLERATALDRDAYRVDVIAAVNLAGQLGGHDIQDSFEPRLPFSLDDFELYLRPDESPDGGDTDPTTTVMDGFLESPSLQPSTIDILGAQLPVTTARAISVAGLILALAVGAAAIVPYLTVRGRGEAARVLAEYDAILVSVIEPPAAKEIIDVRGFADLARLSERSGRMILHAGLSPEHHFYLQDGGVTYHLRLIDPEPGPSDGGAG